MCVCVVVTSSALQMNAFAKAAGATSTVFSNPHGMDAIPDHTTHQSTAMDVSRMTLAALQNPLFREIVRTKRHATTVQRVRYPGRVQPITFSPPSVDSLSDTSDSESIEDLPHPPLIFPSIDCPPAVDDAESGLVRRKVCRHAFLTWFANFNNSTHVAHMCR